MNSNISDYECSQASAWELFDGYLDGDAQAHVAVVSGRRLGEVARNACDSSLHALGYGRGACTYVTLAPENRAPDAAQKNARAPETPVGTEGAERAAACDNGVQAKPPRGATADAEPSEEIAFGLPALDAGALTALLEGLDPICIVATDRAACELMAKAYGEPVRPDAANVVLGRSVAAFADLTALMATPESKQKAWALFKTLPKFATLNRKKL